MEPPEGRVQGPLKITEVNPGADVGHRSLPSPPPPGYTTSTAMTMTPRKGQEGPSLLLAAWGRRGGGAHWERAQAEAKALGPPEGAPCKDRLWRNSFTQHLHRQPNRKSSGKPLGPAVGPFHPHSTLDQRFSAFLMPRPSIQLLMVWGPQP